MGTLDKEIRIIAVKGTKGDAGQDGQDGQDGKSSYQLAVENQLFSGTLAEWIETFSTPENYITRIEFQKVTQAQYDAMAQAGTLVPNCYYLIIDDTTAQDFATLQNTVGGLQTTVGQLQTDVSNIGGRTYTHYCAWNFNAEGGNGDNMQGFISFVIVNHSNTQITPSNIDLTAIVCCSGFIYSETSPNPVYSVANLRLPNKRVDFIKTGDGGVLNNYGYADITNVTSYTDNVY